MRTSPAAICVLLGALTGAHAATAADTAPKQAFFANLQSLCGATFEGGATFILPESKATWEGKTLVAKVATCTSDEIRIPLQVGEDRSRTWIIRRAPNGGLLLSHDHRHADGTPDKQTDYGGPANESGTPLAAHFHADAYTAKLIPAAATNVWHVSLAPDGSRLNYSLERDGKPRMAAELFRKK
jgi:hypothetical protein